MENLWAMRELSAWQVNPAAVSTFLIISVLTIAGITNRHHQIFPVFLL